MSEEVVQHSHEPHHASRRGPRVADPHHATTNSALHGALHCAPSSPESRVSSCSGQYLLFASPPPPVPAFLVLVYGPRLGFVLSPAPVKGWFRRSELSCVFRARPPLLPFRPGLAVSFPRPLRAPLAALLALVVRKLVINRKLLHCFGYVTCEYSLQ